MKFLGTPYPITKNSKGYFRTQSDLATIKSDLLILLLTNPGERVFLPDFGTPLKRLIFEQNDAVLEQEAKNIIINSINKWEPRITVESIEVVKPSRENLNKNDAYQDVDNILYIKIRFFDPEQITNVQELKLEIPLS
jgi:phage baseplate assembly protein W